MVLLIDETTERVDTSIGWQAWLNAARQNVSDHQEVRFNTPDLAVSAATAGAGVLMGRVSLTDAALRDGRLVMPFDLTLRSKFQYRIVCPKGAETRPHIASFIEWLDNEADEMAALSRDRRFASAVDP